MANLEAISYINLGDGNHPIDAVTVGGKTVPDVSDFITKSVNDLTNYYLKSETYTQEEVNTLIGNILQFHYEIAASTSAVSTPENNVLYLIGPTGDGEDKYEEYVYPNSTDGWTKIGDTTIDLTDYVSINMLNETLEDYKTSSEIEEIELIIAAALNDLNERLIYIEEDFAQGVTGQIYNVEESISSLDSRVSTLETNASSYLTSEADPVFLSSPAGSITNADISSWNAKQDALVYDSIPTENSDNLVKSGVLYSVLTRTEYVTATALNDLNDRIQDLESVDLSSDYVTISQYNDDEEVIATAINEMDDRIQDLENSVLTSEVDPIFSASPAADITYTDITNWNSKTSNTGTLTDIIFNGVNASVSEGVATISLSDYVSLSDYESDEFVFATAINDLNDRIMVLESGSSSDIITAITVNGVGVSVSGGVAAINIDLSNFISTSHAAASITASDIANWNSKTSNTGTLTGVKVNNISGTVSGGVASVSLTLDNISDGSTRKLADYVTYASYDDDQEVIAAAFNDLNGRLSAVESSTLHAVTFNGVSASVSNGVASIAATLGDVNMTEITYASLVSLRSNASLIPGMQYRITDYTCTTTQADTRSDGNVFDIIVTADSTNKLNENARAALHSGDTYFSGVDLNAWELKYSLDNDTTKFAWADSTNGKGVIYWMKDENNNECPYDFKNIQFKRYAITDISGSYADYDTGGNTVYGLQTSLKYSETQIHYSYSSSNISKNGLTFTVDSSMFDWYYTFTWRNNEEESYDLSVIYKTLPTGSNQNTHNYVYGNKMDACYDYSSEKMVLNCNTLIQSYGYDGYFYGMYGNVFGCDCRDNVLGPDIKYNTFGNDCRYNILSKYCMFNHFKDSCYSNIFGESCQYNVSNYGLSSNFFGKNCMNNIFNGSANSNAFGEYTQNNIFGDSFDYNKLGSSCNANSFGNYNQNNALGVNCRNNHFENNCQYITLGSRSNNNSFGNDSRYIKFGNDSTIKDCYKNITIENGNNHIYLYCTASTSWQNCYQNVKITSGVNDSYTWKTITDSNVGQTYETVYRPVNSQTISV